MLCYSFMVLPEKVWEFLSSPSLLLGYPNRKGHRGTHVQGAFIAAIESLYPISRA